jgi:DNA-binding XRE family transcriptional regulator
MAAQPKVRPAFVSLSEICPLQATAAVHIVKSRKSTLICRSALDWKAAVLKAAKAIRTDADLTQAELASLLDLATCQVVNLERGHRAIRVVELLEIALVCGVTPRRLAAQIFFNFKR